MLPIRRAALLGACAAVSLALASCGKDVLEPMSSVQIDVRASEFVRTPTGAATIPFVLKNLSDRSVGIPQCGPSISVEVDRLERIRWVGYSSTYCVAIALIGPVALVRGAERAGATGISEAGTYRIRLEVDGHTHTSPTFVVR
ncbi:hypothetical protein [Gemmatimonas sp.]|uniref:hypothetical protein n=1 Tax=Gemmatimonas sp. TaxID=1962908 RepID=UPI003983A8B7